MVAPELLSAPHPYTRPLPGLAPALEAAWGQPSNQIQTCVRCSLNRRQQKTESRGSKGPRETTTLQKTLKCTLKPVLGTLNSQGAQSGKGNPTHTTQKAQIRSGHGPPPQGEGVSSLTVDLGHPGGKSCLNPEPQRSWHSKSKGATWTA